MSFSADVIVGRARALVGTPFRPQGRDRGSGLDCVGLILCTFDISPEEVRRDYRLRGRHRREMEARLVDRFRRISPRHMRAGDVLLCEITANQVHLAINCGGSFVHADARLRHVVETPGDPTWPVTGVFRHRTRRSKSS